MTGRSELAREPFTGVQIRIGVMGSAGEPLEPTVVALSRRLGWTIADRGCCLLTGACPGLPHEAVLGAKEVGGHVVGISPAGSLGEHVEVFRSPYREYDVLIFTGLGLMGRGSCTTWPGSRRPGGSPGCRSTWIAPWPSAPPRSTAPTPRISRGTCVTWS